MKIGCFCLYCPTLLNIFLKVTGLNVPIALTRMVVRTIRKNSVIRTTLDIYKKTAFPFFPLSSSMIIYPC